MASSTLCCRTEAGGGVLPLDTLYDILIRLPTKELCRLRVVCWSWRSLLSDPQFIAAHDTRHRQTLIVAGHHKSYCGDGILCDIIDLSGRVIKQIRTTEDEWMISTQRNLACIAKGTFSSKRCQLLNLVTGDRFSLPEGLSQEHTPRKVDFMNYVSSVALGQVASTREFKLLRVIDNALFNSRYEQLCEVFTFGGRASSDTRWRGKKAAHDRVDMSPLSRVVVDGVVYFLLDKDLRNKHVRPKGIASFDLLTEEWRPILQQPVHVPGDYPNLSLAAVNGSLVLLHVSTSMDLWFLVDFGKSLWVKKHTVQINLSVRDEFIAHPLVILKNGSIVTYIGPRGLLRIYNPKTNTYTNVAEMGSRVIGLYTGNLLNIANDTFN